MADFDLAFGETMINEGGYVHDPDDRGGETYRGVARAFHGDWAGWKIVDETKQSQPTDLNNALAKIPELDELVKAFYRKKFWNPIRGDELENQHLANELFDTGVNMGVGTVVKFWQESLNLLNRNQRDYPDIAVDGQVGGQTLEATRAYFQKNPKSDSLLKLLNLFQGFRYVELCRKDSVQRKFIHGWLKRVEWA